MSSKKVSEIKGRDFLRQIIDEDLEKGNYKKVITRFPPEPNGYLHIGHAKSICINFGIARDYPGGKCHLRMDDSDPAKESYEYVESIKTDVKWLGFDWQDNLFFASDYFEKLYSYAEYLIKKGKAYVCSLSEEKIREYRGTVTQPGKHSPYRQRSVEENLDLFRKMRAGEFNDGEHVLRAKIDMASPNMKMRDPLLYRIRHVNHYRQGEKWCIYPLYDFTHGLSDYIEGITHSICTLEFENNRELYDWILNECDIKEPRPHQYEFARLNVNYNVVSKRKLLELVENKYVNGWDDPRMPTLAGMRRRGITPEAIRNFCESVGIAKSNSVVDMAQFEYYIRDDLNKKVPRALAVLHPLKVIIENYPDSEEEQIEASFYPHDVPLEGSRKIPFTREIYIDRDDFMENPPEGYYRLYPGGEVRLRHAYIIKCEKVIKDKNGQITELRCSYDFKTKSGADASGKKIKGTIHWVSAKYAKKAEVKLYDRLFNTEFPNVIEDSFNKNSLNIIKNALVEPALIQSKSGDRYQFERLGYFYLDPIDFEQGNFVFNRIVTLRDSWSKSTKHEKPDKVASEKHKPQKQQEKVEFDINELPEKVRINFNKYTNEFGIHKEEALTIAREDKLCKLFEESVSLYNNSRGLSGFIANEIARELKENGDISVTPDNMAELVKLLDNNVISVKIAKDVIVHLIKGEGSALEIVEKYNLKQINDSSALESIVDSIIKTNPENVAAFRSGKTKLLGFFVGQAMKKTQGKANPELLNEIILSKLK